MTMQALGQANPPPKPPLIANDYGDGEKRLEPNAADPDHILALDLYRQELGIKALYTSITLGVEVDEVDTEAVARVRRLLKKQGAQLPEGDEDDDLYVYIVHICATTQAELTALQKAILQQGQPTEEVIAEAIATFPNHVQRPGSLELAASQVGDVVLD